MIDAWKRDSLEDRLQLVDQLGTLARVEVDRRTDALQRELELLDRLLWVALHHGPGVQDGVLNLFREQLGVDTPLLLDLVEEDALAGDVTQKVFFRSDHGRIGNLGGGFFNDVLYGAGLEVPRVGPENGLQRCARPSGDRRRRPPAWQGR